jgi:hypothetical protein
VGYERQRGRIARTGQTDYRVKTYWFEPVFSRTHRGKNRRTLSSLVAASLLSIVASDRCAGSFQRSGGGEGLSALPLLLDVVVGGLAGDDDVVDVTFAQASAGDANETCILL